MKKQKQGERFELDQMPPIFSEKKMPAIKKPFKDRAAQWLHIQHERLRREWERRRREREQKRSIKPTAPSVGQLEKELARVRKRRRHLNTVRNVLLTVCVLSVLAFAVSVCFPPVRIAGDSMSPALKNGDVIVCVRTQTPQRGDLIAFAGARGQTWVKRVIALSGDEVDILPDGTVTVNGHPTDEPYAHSLTRGDCDIEFPYVVPHGRVFVLGDHRALSIDSRHAIPGCIAYEQITGRAAWRIYPFADAGKIQ